MGYACVVPASRRLTFGILRGLVFWVIVLRHFIAVSYSNFLSQKTNFAHGSRSPVSRCKLSKTGLVLELQHMRSELSVQSNNRPITCRGVPPGTPARS